MGHGNKYDPFDIRKSKTSVVILINLYVFSKKKRYVFLTQGNKTRCIVSGIFPVCH